MNVYRVEFPLLGGWGGRRKQKPLSDRIRESVKIDADTGCWIWQKNLTYKGYGLMRIGSTVKKTRRNDSAHRVSYQEFVGPIADGLFVLHRCDVRSCCNPEHLFLGTQRDNIQDALQKNRFPVGERRSWAKLTDEKVRECRDRREGGESLRSLALECGVSQKAIDMAVKRQSWRHVL